MQEWTISPYQVSPRNFFYFLEIIENYANALFILVYDRITVAIELISLYRSPIPVIVTEFKKDDDEEGLPEKTLIRNNNFYE